MERAKKISLVIPTRERAQTLRYTLATAVAQTTEDYEILVSDNASQDGTREVVAAFADRRIRYLNSGRRLPMSEHWEFAIGHSRGEYCIVIGDDDAVMPNGIDRLQQFMAKTPHSIYCWPTHVYLWPGYEEVGGIGHIAQLGAPRELDLDRMVKFAIKWGLCNYKDLPHLYHSAVSSRVLEQLRERTGKLFHSTSPDVYMSYALPAVCRKAIKLGDSITVVGHSPQSNSGGLAISYRSEILRKFTDEYAGYQLHPALPHHFPMMVNLMPDAVLVGMDLFPEYYGHLKPNFSAIWAFVQRVMRYRRPIDMIREARTLRRYHPFSILPFLFYSLAFKYARIVRQMSVHRVDNVPGDILAFVALDALKAKGA